jgi:hypothetical protein
MGDSPTTAKPAPGADRWWRLAGQVGLVAPIAVLALNFLTPGLRRGSATAALVIASLCWALLLVGLGAAVVALVAGWRRRQVVWLLRAGFGLLLGAGIVATTFYLGTRPAPPPPAPPAPDFAFTAPPGYQPAIVNLPQRPLYAYLKGDPADPAPDLLLALEDLGGTIGQDDLAPLLRQRPEVTLERLPWQGRQIDVMRLPETLDGTAMVTFVAQVPLTPRAVQLRLFGPADREAELRADLLLALAQLAGPTNWPAP